jgi:hypothetical protein
MLQMLYEPWLYKASTMNLKHIVKLERKIYTLVLLNSLEFSSSIKRFLSSNVYQINKMQSGFAMFYFVHMYNHRFIPESVPHINTSNIEFNKKICSIYDIVVCYALTGYKMRVVSKCQRIAY